MTPPSARTIKRMRPVLGTFVEIGIVLPATDSRDDATLTALFDRSFNCLTLIHQLLSFHELASDLSRLNLTIPGHWISLNRLSLRVLRLAKAMMHASDGHFNCTLAGHLVTAGILPDHGFGSYLPVGRADDFEVTATHARRLVPVLLTLDGIGKGFAVDLAINYLRTTPVSGGWVNAGGDLRAFGEITLPIHYRTLQGDIGALGGLNNAAIATSSSASNARHPGLLLTGAGEPVPSSQWTVMAHKAWRADALTKVAASLSPHLRTAQLSRLGGTLVYQETANTVP